ncbi:class I SAM-dependent methyltransferase [Clostridium sp.]|uniref:tRNA (adenine(22)-N(1))-methyltransferase n=1 Tax=Clostridium sp. TaxID=1506 RepID=UPI00262FFFEE|nr:class I SAM-dependent methyltransferase [Clostridium sp.]
MEISERLKFIIKNVENTEVLADIGTDHGYIPIYAIQNKIANKVIACDINKEPLDKAKLNSILEEVDENIEFRLGSGLKVLHKKEANVAIIAGMGGNLIRDILEENVEKVKELDYLILQPAQNPEVLREYLYSNEYEVIKEDLCYEENKYYELFKVRKKDGENIKIDSIYYEISPRFLISRHPLLKGYLEMKLENYNKINNIIKEDTINAIERKKTIDEKIEFIKNTINIL